jgi:hypothetical protein
MDRKELKKRLENGEDPLELSIEKWEDIVEKNNGQNPMYWNNCALCLTFWNADCTGCPVRERTGHDCCEGTPFEALEAHLSECRACERIKNGDGLKLCKDGMEVAKKELEFLKSLRSINDKK